MALGGLLGGTVGKAVVEMVGDSSKLQSDLTAAQGKTTQSTAAMAQRMNQFKMAAAAAGAVAAVAFVKFAAASIKAADDAERSQLKLQNALRNNAAAASVTISAYNEQAAALQDLTGVEDDTINETQAMLATFNLTGEEIQRLTPLILDLAAAKGISLNTATRAVARSTGGTTGALSRMGIVVDADKMKVDAFGATMDALSGTQGSAAAQAKTLAGQQAILAANFDDLQESVGTVIIAGLNPLVRALNFVVDLFNKMPGPMKAVAVTGGIAVVALVALGAVVAAVSAGLGGLGLSLTRASAAEGQLAITAIAAAGAQGVLGAATTTLGAVMSASLPIIAAVALAIVGLVAVYKAWKGAEEALHQSSNASINLMSAWGDQLRKGIITQDQFVSKTKTLIAADKEAGISTEDLAAEQQHANSIQQRYTNGTLKQSEAAEKAAAAIRDQKRAMLQLAGGFLGVQAAQNTAIDASREYRQAAARVNALTRQGKRGTKEYADAVREKRDAELNAVQSQVDLEGAMADYVDEQIEGEITQRKVNAEVRKFGRDAGLSKQDINGLIESTNKMLGSYKKVPESKKTKITAENVEPTLRSLESIRTKIDQIRDKTVTITVNEQHTSSGGGRGNAAGGILGMQHGGVVTRPTLLVGEGTRRTFAGRGAEAVVPFDERGIGILAKALELAMGKGTRGHVTIPVHVHGNVIGVDNLAADIERAHANRRLLVGGRKT